MRLKALIRRASPATFSRGREKVAVPLPQQERGGWRRLFSVLAFLLILFFVATGVGAHLAWTRYTQSLGPIDLMASREGSTVVLDRDGRLLRPFTMANGIWRLPATVHDVDPRYVAMLIAYEDARFPGHSGVDSRALLRAAGQWLVHGHVVSGGSTLSMQVARLIEPRAERSLSAKLRQAARAVQIEQAVGKEGVLDRYLMLAPFGGNLEGVRGGLARLSRQGAKEAHDRRGRPARRPSAIARSAPAGPGAGGSARRARPRAQARRPAGRHQRGGSGSGDAGVGPERSRADAGLGFACGGGSRRGEQSGEDDPSNHRLRGFRPAWKRWSRRASPGWGRSFRPRWS